MPPGPGTTANCGPNGNLYMSWKAQLPSPNSAATTASVATAATSCLRGTRTSSQAPNSEIAPRAGTQKRAACSVLRPGAAVHV